MVVLSVLFLKRLYAELNFKGGLWYRLSLLDMKGRELLPEEGSYFRPFVGTQNEIAIDGTTSAVDLDSGWEALATDIGKRVFALFNCEATHAELDALLARVKRNVW